MYAFYSGAFSPRLIYAVLAWELSHPIILLLLFKFLSQQKGKKSPD